MLHANLKDKESDIPDIDRKDIDIKETLEKIDILTKKIETKI